MVVYLFGAAAAKRGEEGYVNKIKMETEFGSQKIVACVFRQLNGGEFGED